MISRGLLRQLANFGRHVGRAHSSRSGRHLPLVDHELEGAAFAGGANRCPIQEPHIKVNSHLSSDPNAGLFTLATASHWNGLLDSPCLHCLLTAPRAPPCLARVQSLSFCRERICNSCPCMSGHADTQNRELARSSLVTLSSYLLLAGLDRFPLNLSDEYPAFGSFSPKSVVPFTYLGGWNGCQGRSCSGHEPLGRRQQTEKPLSGMAFGSCGINGPSVRQGQAI